MSSFVARYSWVFLSGTDLLETTQPDHWVCSRECLQPSDETPKDVSLMGRGQVLSGESICALARKWLAKWLGIFVAISCWIFFCEVSAAARTSLGRMWSSALGVTVPPDQTLAESRLSNYGTPRGILNPQIDGSIGTIFFTNRKFYQVTFFRPRSYAARMFAEDHGRVFSTKNRHCWYHSDWHLVILRCSHQKTDLMKYFMFMLYWLCHCFMLQATRTSSVTRVCHALQKCGQGRQVLL